MGLGWRDVLDASFLGGSPNDDDLSPSDCAAGSVGAGGLFVLMGVLRIGVSRVGAFRMFERARYVDPVVQAFSFYSEQFAALSSWSST